MPSIKILKVLKLKVYEREITNYSFIDIVSSRGTGISSPDICTLHLSPLYHLEEVIEEVSRNRY